MTLNDLKEALGYPLDFSSSTDAIDPRKKHDFVFAFDASNCNPNGDPDNDNLPRQDLETRKGLVTDVCLKRKVRDFVGRVCETSDANRDQGFDLYVKHRGLLKREHEHQRGRGEPGTLDENQARFRQAYWDVRLFGAVLTVGKQSEVEDEANTDQADKTAKKGPAKKSAILNGGQCVGPVQMAFAESVDPIQPTLMSIVRDARTENPKGSDSERAVSAMPGNKPYSPYGLYIATGHYSPMLDRGSLVGEADLALLWNGLRQMFDQDLSSSRPGSMRSLGLWVFSHEHRLGNAPAHLLISQVRFEKKSGVATPRSFGDYEVVYPTKAIPGVHLSVLFNDWS